MWDEARDSALIAAIADDAPVGIWVARAPGGELIYANDTFADIMGMRARADVAVGEYAGPYGIHHRSGAPYPEAEMPFVRALRERRTVVVDDIAIHRHDGQKVFIRAVAKPTLEPSGEVSRVAIAFIDITREVQAEEQRERLRQDALRTAEQLNCVISALPVVLFAGDLEGRIRFLAGRSLDEEGSPARALIGRKAGEVYGEKVGNNFQRAIAGETLTDVVESGGRTYQVTYRPDRNERGEVTGVVGVAVDTTEQRQMAAQLLQADRMATVGTMAASVAHEINTPAAVLVNALGSLRSQLSAVEGAAGDAQRVRAALGIVEATLNDASLAGNRIRSTCLDLTTFSRVDEARTRVCPREVLESALRLVPRHLRADLTVTRELQPVPGVLAQEARLAQVFLNLIMNAIQALPSEGPHQLTLRTRTGADGQAQIDIEDSGVGIPAEVVERVFEPFFTTKAPGEGTGLGLSICREIVSSLGGSIALESRRPHGTIARVVLPPAPTASRPAIARPAERSPRSRVLIVDDDDGFRRICQIALRETHEVAVAASGREALELLRNGQRYDLILCDLMMPQMSGMELYQALSADHPGLERELIFMTGGAYTRAAQLFLAGISNRCLEKPFDVADAISMLLARRAQAS